MTTALSHICLLLFALASTLPVDALAKSRDIPAKGHWDVRDFGAKGDGRTIDSPAINQAIVAASEAGGGTIHLSAGNYLSYTIRLRSHIRLFLDAGATITAAEPSSDGMIGYDHPEPNPADQYQDFGHSHWRNSLIWGEDLVNISIVGPGRIYGYGLSRGWDHALRDLTPEERRAGLTKPPQAPPITTPIENGLFNYPHPDDAVPPGVGDKSIALKNCRNVTLRDFTIQHGGHFGILATGVDNLTIDNLLIDTNRDGMNIDSCRNVRITNCSVNSPSDDGICIKSSYGLGEFRATENLTISDCYVSGFEEGTLVDGTRRPHSGYTHGRIKLGTESSGGFKNITVSNCVFESSRGLALETVDGGALEDISITNITMRNIVNAPIFMILGGRNRSPGNPPRATFRRVKISHIVAYNVARDHGIFLTGLPGNRLEDIELSDIRIHYAGGGTAEDAAREIPERERGYPEPKGFGNTPAYGLFARHVTGLKIRDLDFRLATPDVRPAIALHDVHGVRFDRVDAPTGEGIPRFHLRDVSGFEAVNLTGAPDTRLPDPTTDRNF